MQLLLSTEITREALWLSYYLFPFLGLILSFGLNYLLGVFAVARLCKNHMPGKAEKLCFIPFMRYYYVGKLAFSGKFSKKGLSWVTVAFPLVRGIEIIADMVVQAVTTAFVYASNVDIVHYFEKDTTGMYWQSEVEEQIIPAFVGYLDMLSGIIFFASIVFGAILFISFYRRFRTRQGVFFGILSLLFIDGIFLFACRNNATVEQELDRMRAAYPGGMPPYGNPYQNPYGNPYANQNPYQNPYGNPNPYQNPNPYGQGNPYGSPNPYATPNDPYGQNGTSFGAPQHPNAGASSDPFSEFDGNANGNASGNDSPFGEFENPDNKN